MYQNIPKDLLRSSAIVEDYEDDKLCPALPPQEDVDNKTLFEEYLNNCNSSKDQ